MATNTYLIQKGVEEQDWDAIPAAGIDNYPWSENGYTPKAEAKVYYTHSHLYVKLKAFETKVKAEFHNYNDMVCLDSCLEFFLNANPDQDGRFLNFEINPLGTLLLYIGGGRHERVAAATQEDLVSFQFKTTLTKETLQNFAGPFWEVEFQIPFSFLERHYGKMEFVSGKRMKGNFYKCGDESEFPHYGCWNLVTTKEPDFHRPECFGDLIFA